MERTNVPRVHQGSKGESTRHQDDLCRIEGRTEDQRSGRVPQAVRRGRKEEVAGRPAHFLKLVDEYQSPNLGVSYDSGVGDPYALLFERSGQAQGSGRSR